MASLYFKNILSKNSMDLERIWNAHGCVWNQNCEGTHFRRNFRQFDGGSGQEERKILIAGSKS